MLSRDHVTKISAHIIMCVQQLHTLKSEVFHPLHWIELDAFRHSDMSTQKLKIVVRIMFVHPELRVCVDYHAGDKTEGHLRLLLQLCRLAMFIKMVSFMVLQKNRNMLALGNKRCLA